MGVSSPAIFVVLGNEIGGVGKSTIAANLAIGIARTGMSVGLIDLDSRQRAIARWHQRRIDVSERTDLTMVIPVLSVIEPSFFDSISLNEECDFQAFEDAVERLDTSCDVIIADTPPGDSYLARLAHSIADIVLTPIEDDLFDREVLFGDCAIRQTEHNAKGYAATIEQARRVRRGCGCGDAELDWLVVQNRCDTFSAPLASNGEGQLAAMATEMGFRTAEGLRERVIYRALFATGRCVFDHPATTPSGIGHAAVNARVEAREELERLINALYLPFAAAGTDMIMSN